MRGSNALGRAGLTRRSASLAALAWGLLATSGAHAEERLKVGVVVSLRVGVDRATSSELAGRLAAVLEERYEVDVIAGAEANALLPQELPESCVAQPACIRDIAKRLNVKELLFLSMVSTSDRSVQIDATWVDGPTAAAASRPMMEVDPRDPDLEYRRVAMKMLPDAPLRKSTIAEPPVPPLIERPAPPPPARRTAIGLGTWLAVGATGASAVAAVTFGLLARDEFHDLEATCPVRCDTDALRLRNALADVFLGATVASAGLATFLYLRDRSRSRSESALTLSASSGQIGVNFSGEF